MTQAIKQLPVISDQQLRSLAPAVFARSGSRKMSDKYVPIPTIDVIRTLSKEGFVVTSTKQDKVRRRDPKFCRHMVSMVHRQHLKPNGAKLGATPQAIIVGSANGTKKFQLRAGIYVFACENGLIIGTDFAKMHQKHIHTETPDVLKQVREVARKAGSAVTVASKWASIKLSDQRANAFAREAAALRFGKKAHQYKVADLLTPRRDSDAKRDLWHVFNVVQENCMRGGIVGAGRRGRAIRARSLNGITNEITFNESLWALAEKYAKRK